MLSYQLAEYKERRVTHFSVFEDVSNYITMRVVPRKHFVKKSFLRNIEERRRRHEPLTVKTWSNNHFAMGNRLPCG